MECECLNDISDAWVQEKLNCTNAAEGERKRRIEERIRLNQKLLLVVQGRKKRTP